MGTQAIHSASTVRVLSAQPSSTNPRENSFALTHRANGRDCTPHGYALPCMPFVLLVGAEDIFPDATQPARLGWQRHYKPLRLRQTKGSGLLFAPSGRSGVSFQWPLSGARMTYETIRGVCFQTFLAPTHIFCAARYWKHWKPCVNALVEGHGFSGAAFFFQQSTWTICNVLK